MVINEKVYKNCIYCCYNESLNQCQCHSVTDCVIYVLIKENVVKPITYLFFNIS